MKKTTLCVPSVLLGVLVLLVGALVPGCSCSMPFTLKITPDPQEDFDTEPLNLGSISGITFENATVGSPIPDRLKQQVNELCSGNGLLTQADIYGSVQSDISFTLSSIIIEEIVLKATKGSFDYLTSVSVKWRPKPVNGEQPPDIDFGAGQIESDQITITLPQPVNFLDLLKNAEQGSEEECPHLIIDIDGTVPAVPPEWDTFLNRGTISGTARLL